MANASILAAFERMWQHIVLALNEKSDTTHNHVKSDVGLDNVDNVKQYSVDNPPPYPVRSVNGKTGSFTLTASDVGALPSDTVIPSVDGLASEEYVDAVIGTIGISASSDGNGNVTIVVNSK